MKTKSMLIYILFAVLTINSQSRIDKLSWLEGNWSAEKWGGTVEEYWSAPNGNTIIGMFRMIADGEIKFSEHFSIIENSDNITLKLKHFNADFTSWEKKDEYVEFPLIETGENYASFEGIKYELLDSGKLKATLEIENEGKIETEIFIFEKM